jgi:thiol-disulfide isomerase/thioredoxin
MQTRRSTVALLLGVTTVLADAQLASGKAGDGVKWYRGSIDSAFARARKENRPLFLYWGAVWCPPCNQIKRHVFTDARFRRAIGGFVAVYLDGDTERAQVWGEKLDARGYPSILLLNPLGQEVGRIPTGVSVERFVELMKLAARRKPSIVEVLRRAQAGKATRAEWQLLAYYDWYRPGLEPLLGKRPAATFFRLRSSVPTGLETEGDRLLLVYLTHAFGGDTDKPAHRPAEAEVAAMRRRLLAILGDHARVLATLEPLQYEAAGIARGLYPRKTPARGAALEAWLQAMQRVADDESLSPRERVAAVAARVELTRLRRPKGALPPTLRRQAREMVKWADRSARQRHGRQAVISGAAYLLWETGDRAAARRLLRAELERSHAPYYFMSVLADLAERRGDKRSALRWLKRAHDAAKGRATRFQWGVQYLSGLMRLRPHDVTRIAEVSRRVVDELLGRADAFHGRNQQRLQRLAAAYRDWAKRPRRQGALAALLASWKPRCAKLDPTSRPRCERYLARLLADDQR